MLKIAKHIMVRYQIILVAHGSRLNKFNNDIYRIANILKKRFPYDIYVWFLKYFNKDIFEMIDKKSDVIIIVPFFISYGIHVERDLKEIIDKLKAKTNKKIIVTKPLCANDKIVDIVVENIEECIRSQK